MTKAIHSGTHEVLYYCECFDITSSERSGVSFTPNCELVLVVVEATVTLDHNMYNMRLIIFKSPMLQRFL